MGNRRQEILTEAFALPFGQGADGKLRSPSEIFTPCHCPVCKRPLERRATDLLDLPQFLHPKALDGQVCYEASVAARACQELVHARQLTLPVWHRASLDRLDRHGKVHHIEYRVEAISWQYSRASLAVPYPTFRAEATLIHEEGPLDPDVLVIEIKACRGDNTTNTHLGALHALKIRSLEIDVSRATFADFASARFNHYVCNEAPRAWLYNTEAEATYETRHEALNDRFEAAQQSSVD
jgi:hypothetical protein